LKLLAKLKEQQENKQKTAIKKIEKKLRISMKLIKPFLKDMRQEYMNGKEKIDGE